MQQMTQINMVFGPHASSGHFTTTKKMGPDEYPFTERVELGDKPNTIKTFRFAKINKREDWLSQRRNANLDDPPGPGSMNSIALGHRGGLRHGLARQDPSMASPFISVATDWEALHDASEGNVMKIIEGADHLVEFHTPKHYLFRPVPCSSNSLKETEWLYFDYPEYIGNFLVAIYHNPYKRNLALVRVDAQTPNSIPTNIPAHRT